MDEEQKWKMKVEMEERKYKNEKQKWKTGYEK